VTTDIHGWIDDIVEKEVISTQAVTGVYYFRQAGTFFEAAHEVITSGFKQLGEYYVSSALSVMIREGRHLRTYNADSAMLGTPNELQLFEMAARVAKAL
jgi:dTDP-glucose pyrophosphorylase